MDKNTAIVWLRRDLRLADNPALHAAAERHERVLVVYIHAPAEEAPWQPGGASRWWLHHSLSAFSGRLHAQGGRLLLRNGPTLPTLRGLLRATGAGAVYWNRLYEPAIATRDRAVAEALAADGVSVESFHAALLLDPAQPHTRSGEPFRVFTPYWRAFSGLPLTPHPVPAPRHLSPPRLPPEGVPLESLQLLPTIAWDAGLRYSWAPGEAGAAALLERFCKDAAEDYKSQRDFPGIEATSRLSPHLHFGEIGPAQVFARLRRLVQGREGSALSANCAHYQRELGWREFGHHLLWQAPQTPEEALYPKYAAFPWRQPREYATDLRAWQRGRTGVPIVDAGMRQLWHTGWMHNRVRMIVASYLVKNLLIPWQEGARWFWDTLVDADLANNTLGWQWSAGCGADAAPYFRVFNPVLQGQKFDGQGAYVRRWVPELARLPDDELHAPWQAPPLTLAAAGVQLGRDYPAPLVDLAASRQRALAAYARIKSEAAPSAAPAQG